MPRGDRILKWFTTLKNGQALSDNSQITFDLLADLSVSQTEKATITRILLEFYLRNDTVQNDKVMDWGIVLLAGEAVSAGAFPDADDEDERVDWLGRGRIVNTTDLLFRPENMRFRAYDLRAQRIIRDEFQQLRLILDVDSNGTGGLFVNVFCRVLLRMP